MLLRYLLFSFVFLQCYGASLNLEFLKNSEIKKSICNDGTPGAYWIQKKNSTKWLIHLQGISRVISFEGGWWCWDKSTCEARKQQFPYLMSSNGLPKIKNVTEGIFSENSIQNPSFYNSNMVIVHYCSSDGFSGEREASQETFGNHFRGKRIIETLIHDLFQFHNLNNAKEILLTGCSAGGMGLSINTNFISQLVKINIPNVKLLALNDAGHFVDAPVLDSKIETMKGNMIKGIKLWNSQLDRECLLNYPSNPYLCLMNQYSLPFTKIPTLVFNSKFDSFQIGYNVGNFSFTYENPIYKRFALNLGELTTRTLRNIGDLHSVYSPSCTCHCVLMDDHYFEMKLKGHSLRDVFEKWWNKNGNRMMFFDDCQGTDCSQKCPKWPIWPKLE
jgi:O-palmitoleoyl-L-serine hydrolase